MNYLSRVYDYFTTPTYVQADQYYFDNTVYVKKGENYIKGIVRGPNDLPEGGKQYIIKYEQQQKVDVVHEKDIYIRVDGRSE